MFQLAVQLRKKARALEQEAWSQMTVALAGADLSHFWDLMEGLYATRDEDVDSPAGPAPKRAKVGEDSIPEAAALPLLMPSSTISKDDLAESTAIYPATEQDLRDAGVKADFWPTAATDDKRKTWYSCRGCPYKVQNRATVVTHTRRKHLKIKLSCPHCSYSVFSSEWWRKHMQTKHSQEQWFLGAPVLEELSEEQATSLLSRIAAESTR